MDCTYGENLKRLQEIAAQNGLRLNDDVERVKKVVGLMTKNYESMGEWVCPCKQTSKPPVSGVDKTCPCPEWKDEIQDEGHCFCKLFYA